MKEEEGEEVAVARPPPHVLIFPLPIQGHVNPMLNLAELLCLAGFHVTFVLSHYAYNRIHAAVTARFAVYSAGKFSLRSIPDGLPDEHPRAGARVLELGSSLKASAKPLLKQLILTREIPPVTCIIADAFEFIADVAEEIGIPFMFFRTFSACSFWANFCAPQISQAGEFPIQGMSREEMDQPVRSVPGMEEILRRRDIPRFWRVTGDINLAKQTMKSAIQESIRARGIILNTFESLEGPILSLLKSNLQPTRIYPIGPLQAHLKFRLQKKTISGGGGFWQEDNTCLTWLNSQPDKSVVYVSMGSVAELTQHQLTELRHGLINSGHRFLWALRPESVVGSKLVADDDDEEYNMGLVVGWAPQEDVLAHRAVGGFLTHSGWNSTLESIIAGVPMICWPYFADQFINSRYVSRVWNVGIDMKDVCERLTVEKTVRELMEIGERRDELVEKANCMKEMVKKVVIGSYDDGSASSSSSSSSSFHLLIEDIRSLMIQPRHNNVIN